MKTAKDFLIELEEEEKKFLNNIPNEMNEMFKKLEQQPIYEGNKVIIKREDIIYMYGRIMENKKLKGVTGFIKTENHEKNFKIK